MGVLTIYGNRESGNCWKGKWVADYLDIANVWVEVDIFNGESRTPEFLALNPAGQVPVAKLADGRILSQSNAIMLHLAEGSRLIPKDAYQRAKMYEWLFWEQYNHEPSIAVRRARLMFFGKSEQELDPSLLEKGNACLRRMALQLQASKFLVGDTLTLADIALVAYTRMAHEGGFTLRDYPAVEAWVGRVESELGLAPYARTPQTQTA